MTYILLIINLNFIATAIVFNLINLIPNVNNYLCRGFNINLITFEMFLLLLITITLIIIDQGVRRLFSIPFYMLLTPIYGLIMMLIIKTINPTFEPLEVIPGRLLFLGLYFILLCCYPFVENCLKSKFPRE